jgi:hypothetical protein
MITQQFLKFLPIMTSLLCLAMLHWITAMMKMNWVLVNHTLHFLLSHQRKLRELSTSHYDEKLDVNLFSTEKAVLKIHEAN